MSPLFFIYTLLFPVHGNHTIKSLNKQPTRSLVIYPYIYLTCQCQPQEIKAASDGLQDTDLDILNISISRHTKLYNKKIVGLPESDRYYPTRSKWTDFYQELEDAVFTFGLKVAVFIVTDRGVHHAPTEVKYIILSFPCTTQDMVDSPCEIMWYDSSVAGPGLHPIKIMEQD